ncbi:MAG: permease-like cell division protein FtsX [bacterium]|nr:permease-like cell division protein FtsX [bacterium]MCM1374422.1 permease-like cell division protein FtsX [Muribaculum sp.]
MKISTFFYTIQQGFRNLFRNKWYSLASIATISACLFLFGIFYAIVANFQNIVRNAEENVCVTVFFDEDITDSRIEEIGRMISGRAEVADMTYTSAEDAWKDYQKIYFRGRQDEFIAGYPTNPLEHYMSYTVYLNDVSMQDALVTYLYSIEGVRLVNYSELTASTLSGVNLLIGYVSLGIIIVLLAVSVFLISNTVTIGISVRKEEINIMKYIGATDFFVRAPFVLEGMLIGLIGAAIPLWAVHYTYDSVLAYVIEEFGMLSNLLRFLPAETIFAFLVPVCLGVGVGIGLVGSVSTVRKHLHV